MTRVRSYVVLCCLTLIVAVPSSSVASVASPTQATPSRPLVTAINDPIAFSGPKAYVALARTRGAGAAVAKIVLLWDQVAPKGRERPAGFDANAPARPRLPVGRLRRPRQDNRQAEPRAARRDLERTDLGDQVARGPERAQLERRPSSNGRFCRGRRKTLQRDVQGTAARSLLAGLE